MYREVVLPVIDSLNRHTLLTPDKFHAAVHGLLTRAERFPFGRSILKLVAGGDLQDKRLTVNFMGLQFRNPFVLAAGMDKTGTNVYAYSDLGAGAVTVGAILEYPQDPNNDELLLAEYNGDGWVSYNHYGMPGPGREKTAKNLERYRERDGTVIIANIGINRGVKLSEAPRSLANTASSLLPVVDMLEVNVSCPNTGESCQLQNKAQIEAIADELEETMWVADKKVPVSFKIAPFPDLDWDEIGIIAEVAKKRIFAITACNTSKSAELKARYGNTTERKKQQKPGWAELPGGLAGADPDYQNNTTRTIAFIFNNTQGEVPIIGMGGINNARRELDKLEAGASLIGIATGFRENGPSFPNQLNRDLLSLLESEGYSSIADAVGKRITDYL